MRGGERESEGNLQEQDECRLVAHSHLYSQKKQRDGICLHVLPVLASNGDMARTPHRESSEYALPIKTHPIVNLMSLLTKYNTEEREQDTCKAQDQGNKPSGGMCNIVSVGKWSMAAAMHINKHPASLTLTHCANGA